MRKIYKKLFTILLITVFIPNIITYASNDGNSEEKIHITIKGSLGSGKSTI